MRAELLQPLTSLLIEVRSFPLTSLDSAEHDHLVHRLVPRAQTLVEGTSAILAELSDAESSTTEAVSDMAWVARAGLRDHSERLLALGSETEASVVASVVENSLDETTKGLAAILAASGDLMESLARRHTPDLDAEAARLHSARARVHERIAAIEEPTADDHHRTVRTIGSVLATLIGHELFSDLRASDRITIRSLQKRALTWFREGCEPSAAVRMWQDLQGFAKLCGHSSRHHAVDRGSSMATTYPAEERPFPRAVLAEVDGISASADDGADAVPGLSIDDSPTPGLVRLTA